MQFERRYWKSLCKFALINQKSCLCYSLSMNIFVWITAFTIPSGKTTRTLNKIGYVYNAYTHDYFESNKDSFHPLLQFSAK